MSMSVTLFHHSKVQLDSILIISCAIVIFDHYMIHSSAKVSDPISSYILLNITKRALDGSRFFGSVLSNSSGARVTKRRVKI